MQRQQVCNEDVSAPRADHVSVEESREASPHNASDLDGLDPQVEGEDQEENGDGFVVVAAGDGLVLISVVNRYAAKAVRPEKPGASSTQMLRMSTGNVSQRRAW